MAKRQDEGDHPQAAVGALSQQASPNRSSSIVRAGAVQALDGLAVGAEAALHLSLPLEVLARRRSANGLGG
jgi:hypothetical protein